MRRIQVVGSLALLSAPFVAPAQSLLPKGRVSGRIIDSVSGLPMPRVSVSVVGVVGIGFTDSTGRYVAQSEKSGPVTLDVRCPSARRLRGPRAAMVTYELHAGMDSTVDIRLSGRDCEEPPVTSRHITVRGTYVSGFETSLFTSCDTIRVPQWGPYPQTLAQIWIELSDSVVWGRGVKWPRTHDDYPTVFVHWSGLLTGPASYGHLGSGEYLLKVDSVFEVRSQVPTACEHRAPRN
jgi:hypothetical protein